MRKRTWRKRMWRRIIFRSLLVLLLLAAVAAVWLYILPYRDAESFMTTKEPMVLQHREDGTVELTWEPAPKADFYLVEVLKQTEVENEDGETELQLQTIFSREVREGTGCILENLPQDQALTIRVSTMVCYEIPGQTRVRQGEIPMETELCLRPPVIGELTWEPDTDEDTVTFRYTPEPGDKVRLWYHSGDEQWQLLRTLEGSETTVTLGPSGDLPLPKHGQTWSFRLDSYREQRGSVYYSLYSDTVNVIREDLLDRDLWVQVTDEGDNVCTLIWNETKGDCYEIQMKEDSSGEWVTVHTVPRDGNRAFTTGHLKAFCHYLFRVIARGGQTVSGGDAAVSKMMDFHTREAVLYSTIWPIKDLDVYATPKLTQSLGKVKGGTTLCITEVHEGAFGVRWADGVMGYVDSNYVMIDVAEYLGDLCAYDITNSYSSIYMINKYKMPDVTKTVIGGYEDIRMGDGSYLVPLLYPVAQRLLVAAENARDAGYRLKIYDSYRPNRATVMLYDKAEKLLEEPVPGKIPDPTEEDPENLLTYGAVMRDHDKYPLNYFLARGASLHNSGIALDLTIETWDTREEKPMQTQMHDLSYYSMIYRNNKSANLLKEFMEGAGFGGLVSEWWHFQDNEVRDKLKPGALWGGVGPEGWKLSDGGWRYRYDDGSYAVGTVTIGDTEYTFDESGCLVKN